MSWGLQDVHDSEQDWQIDAPLMCDSVNPTLQTKQDEALLHWSQFAGQGEQMASLLLKKCPGKHEVH